MQHMTNALVDMQVQCQGRCQSLSRPNRLPQGRPAPLIRPHLGGPPGPRRSPTLRGTPSGRRSAAGARMHKTYWLELSSYSLGRCPAELAEMAAGMLQGDE